ncbi:MAG: YcxB family protein [Oscillospiraceae bacterium]|jgi:hypothetical protein|nr:YcxB family protein [Oscillospiraceae bacterium]
MDPKKEKPLLEVRVRVLAKTWRQGFFLGNRRAPLLVVWRVLLYLFIPALLVGNVVMFVGSLYTEIQQVLLLPVYVALLVEWLTRPSRLYRRQKALHEGTTTYAFFETQFVRTQEGALHTLREGTAYGLVERAIETKQAFYLFTAEEKICILEKSQLNQPQQKQLRGILRSKLGKKLKVRRGAKK